MWKTQKLFWRVDFEHISKVFEFLRWSRKSSCRQSNALDKPKQLPISVKVWSGKSLSTLKRIFVENGSKNSFTFKPESVKTCNVFQKFEISLFWVLEKLSPTLNPSQQSFHLWESKKWKILLSSNFSCENGLQISITSKPNDL